MYYTLISFAGFAVHSIPFVSGGVGTNHKSTELLKIVFRIEKVKFLTLKRFESF